MRTNLTNAVIDAIAHAPGSARALAHEAGVSESLLYQLQRHEFDATPEVANRLAAALDRWAGRCTVEARKVRAAARQVPDLRTGRTK